MDREFREKYLPDFIYGAIDGLVTTFAIVSGVIGASLVPVIIVILGFANLFADGFSMGISNFLSIRSKNRLDEKNTGSVQITKKPWKAGLATFASFVIVGFIPLLPFVFASAIPIFNESTFMYSIIMTGIAFVIVGYIEGIITEQNKIKSAIMTLLIGALAAGIAYGVGYYLSSLI